MPDPADAAPTAPRAGRRPGPTATRAAILDAARRLFGERGYDATSVRAIARAADVDPALVHHFFGTKEGVFTEALELPVQPSSIRAAILDGPREQVGDRLIRHALRLWRDPEIERRVLGLLRAATTNSGVAELMRSAMTRELLEPVCAALGVPLLRANAVASQLVGLAVVRSVIRLEPVASASDDEIAALVGPTIQRYLDP
ncbi:TetR family transcriptional regulator [Allonocardiopsis opalescens]|uniref:TetR family transcriptional regulator n=1 Tax=Allonocardiopsis opalescens TaxID=1144618 RepID=A0A2T0Q7U4_9ACTN|nr:TetR family transcriptional regulator [Allonocardiopsis opalescens]PRX99868.1 TetR family transcriptional regulator [Allonocardiopsis opalescens]